MKYEVFTIMSFWDLLIEYKAIFGTVLGSVSTLVITYLLRNLGKLHWDIKDWEYDLYGANNIGDIVVVKNFSQAHRFVYNFESVIYNSSESQKSLKDVRIEFKSNTTYITHGLKDSEEKIFAGCGYFMIHNDSTVLNLSPKHMANFRFEGTLGEEELRELGVDFKVLLFAKDYKNKIHRIPIASIHLNA